MYVHPYHTIASALISASISTNICLFAYFKSPFPTELCQKWFLFQHLSTIALQIPFDAVVCLRGVCVCPSLVMSLLFNYVGSVFALYSRSPALGILGIIAILTDGTSNLLIGFFIYRQADFGPLCSTKPGKLGLIPPCVLQDETPRFPDLLLKPASASFSKVSTGSYGF